MEDSKKDISGNLADYKDVANNTNQQVCPSCGYCPTCRRPGGNFNYPNYPYYQYQPLMPKGITTTNPIGNVGQTIPTNCGH